MTAGRSDETLGAMLGALAEEVDWPAAADQSPDLATRVRVAIVEQRHRPAATRPRAGLGLRRVALVLALVALFALAAVAGAAILGLPGLRITFGDPGTVPPTSASGPGSGVSPAVPGPQPPGTDLGLGASVTLEEARARTGRSLPLPDDPATGPPDAVYLDATRADQVAIVWAADASLPATLDADVGLILMSFDGTVQDEFFDKTLGEGSRVEPVTVAGRPGYWISGDPHLFFYRSAEGAHVDDMRRWVGDALIWSDGETTWRLESALGRDGAIRLAETLPD